MRVLHSGGGKRIKALFKVTYARRGPLSPFKSIHFCWYCWVGVTGKAKGWRAERERRTCLLKQKRLQPRLPRWHDPLVELLAPAWLVRMPDSKDKHLPTGTFYSLRSACRAIQKELTTRDIMGCIFQVQLHLHYFLLIWGGDRREFLSFFVYIWEETWQVDPSA